jgi:hypothetical protein
MTTPYAPAHVRNAEVPPAPETSPRRLLAIWPTGHRRGAEWAGWPQPGAGPGARACRTRAATGRPIRTKGKTIMITQRSDQRPRPAPATPKAGARLGRLATALAAVIACLLASAAATSAAFASIIPVPGPNGGYGTAPAASAAPVPVITSVGMPGWQITLIALGAALIAAAAAVLLDRKLAGRRRATATTA